MTSPREKARKEFSDQVKRIHYLQHEVDGEYSENKKNLENVKKQLEAKKEFDLLSKEDEGLTDRERQNRIAKIQGLRDILGTKIEVKPTERKIARLESAIKQNDEDIRGREKEIKKLTGSVLKSQGKIKAEDLAEIGKAKKAIQQIRTSILTNPIPENLEKKYEDIIHQLGECEAELLTEERRLKKASTGIFGNEQLYVEKREITIETEGFVRKIKIEILKVDILEDVLKLIESCKVQKAALDDMVMRAVEKVASTPELRGSEAFSLHANTINNSIEGVLEAFKTAEALIQEKKSDPTKAIKAIADQVHVFPDAMIDSLNRVQDDKNIPADAKKNIPAAYLSAGEAASVS